MNLADFMTFVERHWFGTVLCVLLLLFILRSVMSLFRLGRFKASENERRPESSNFYMVQWAARLLNNFRHALALLIVLFFFAIVIYALVSDVSKCDGKLDATKTVIASLSGLIGSIIGYYFAEFKRTSTDEGMDDEGDSANLPPPTPVDPTGNNVNQTQPGDAPE